MVSPAAFIPLAEETGLITQIGKWVLRTACSFISRLNNSRQEKMTISVNVSVNQLAEDSLVEDVLNILKEYELEPELLTLEITESILMEDVETNLMKLDSLKRHGIKVALDDFGTGYSSLTYLKKLPISILKLDKAFIDDITNDKTDTDIVRNIIIMANTLHLDVTAEGVEKEEQFKCLAGFGCDMIQGYYISRPLPEETIDQLL
jgi:EAL domain-containing protein (putative c-di-GMP-specific phosphodiesterase class I)